jgi:hypothetical protein
MDIAAVGISTSATAGLRVFLKLGLTCCAPAAHIGCFRDEFVLCRKVVTIKA